MFVRGRCLAFFILLSLSACAKPSAEPAIAQPNDGLVTFTGTIFMPDGSPAVGAIVEAIGRDEVSRNVVRTNKAGLVQIRSVFGNGGKIHASSADGAFQATLMVMAADVRTAFAAPVNLSLKPAVPHVVTVLSEGQPVEGARVAARGNGFRVRGVTGSDGVVRLQLPAGESVQNLVAWHPQLGIAGLGGLHVRSLQDTTQLSLLAPAPHTIRLLDTQGEPVAGIKVGVHFNTEEHGWILSGVVEAAQARTDENGEVVLLWAPLGKPQYLQHVDVTILDSVWKEDETDHDKAAVRLITVHIRREMPVTGRLVMPEGASAEGILITGSGFGPHSAGDSPYARAKPDGTFAMQVPSSYGYVLGVSDSQWASDRWSGLILGAYLDRQTDIEIEAYLGAPLTVKVTRGPKHEPVKNAWVSVKSRDQVKFTDELGEERRGITGVGGWARTDAAGMARAAVGKGRVKVRLNSGDWNEEQTIEVSSSEPIEIAFHRNWQGDRKIVARMTLEGAAYTPSKTLVTHAWSERVAGFIAKFHETEIDDADGTIKIAFDAETLSLLVVDHAKQLSGFTQLGPEDSSAELIMQPTATYSGTVLNNNGEPLANRAMRLSTQSSHVEVVESQQTDEAGRFQFTGVAVNMPLRLDVQNENDLPKYSVQSYERLFKAGENRLNDVVRTRLLDDSGRAKTPVASLSERLSYLVRTTNVSRMQTLVILKGDNSPDVSNLTSRLLDSDKVVPIRSYLPLVPSPKQMEAESQAMAERGWPLPEEGEIVLIVVGYDKESVAEQRINTEDIEESVAIGSQFLKQHMQPARDALELLADGKKEALNSGRRLWIVEGGPRCGPCFQLARWIKDHHTILEKDYVIIKLMLGVDQNVAEVIDSLDKQRGGIPWHAIVEPDGTVLTTSKGPLGNIGMPGSVEGIRHFRKMLETTAQQMSSSDIDELIASLSKKKE